MYKNNVPGYNILCEVWRTSDI